MVTPKVSRAIKPSRGVEHAGAEARAIPVDFLSGGGELHALMRKTDWRKTALGVPWSWQRSLMTAVHIMLNSRYPMFIWWGPELTGLYNDAYAPMLGKRHPRALGESARKTWAEIWDTVGPQAEQVMKFGQATWNDELLLVMERNEFTEEAYFTFSYSPIMDDSGRVGAVLGVVTEDTAKVLSRRRLKTLRDLGGLTLSETGSIADAARAGSAALADNPNDVPFALVYLLDEDGKTARLADTVRLDQGTSAAPIEIQIGSASDPWQFARVLESGKTLEVGGLTEKFGRLPAGAWMDDRAERAAVLPLAKARVQDIAAGFLVAGISPRLAFDGEYRGFLELAAGHMATAIANARAYDEERKRAEALAEIDRAKTLFFSNVSHEFRTPLTLMLGPLEELLGRTSVAGVDRERLTVAYRNSLRLLKLVNSLLDFSRVEAGRAQAVYQATDLAAFTADLASNFRSACERAGLRLVVDCPALPAPVHVDRDMWEKIVLNLLSNAFKFTFDGEIEVMLSAQAGQAALSVRDTGIGIAESELPRMFERFHRIESARGRTHEGTGIGLALVQELVKLHGGTVAIASSFGKGTTFTVRVPFGTAHLSADRIDATRTHASTATRAQAFVEEALRWLPGNVGLMAIDNPVEIPAARNAQRARVLFAEDNADMRDYVRRILGAHYETEAVADGLAALETAKARHPDLIVADIMMPRLDGFELLKAIRSEPELRQVPVLLLSARAGEAAKVEGLAAGADGYIVKPFSARELSARVEAALKLANVRDRQESSLRGQRHILEMVAIRAPLRETLDELMRFIEAQESGTSCGILIVTEDGKHFRRGSGPSLPERYHATLDGVAITQPYLGSSGEAAHTCSAVLVPDIASDQRYAEAWRELMRSCGFAAVRSTPVRGSDGRVLASLAIYYGDPGGPDLADLQLIEVAVHLAAIALERDRAVSAEIAASERQQLMIDELNHRVKNTLATVQSFAAQTFRNAASTADGRAAFETRLIALARAHDVLTREQWEGADLRGVVADAMSAYNGLGEDRFHAAGPALQLLPKSVLTLSMAFHELATNAVKYGALSNGTGCVEIAWGVTPDDPRRFRLRWAEQGGPAVEPPRRRGFGSRLVQQGLAQGLAGEVQLRFERSGVVCTIDAPLTEVARAR